MKSRLIFIFFAVFTAYSAYAQQEFSYTFTPFAGFLIPHSPSMKHLQDGHIFGLSFEADLRVDGEKQWHHHYNFPQYGLSFNYMDLASEHLGSSYSILTHLKLPLNKARNVKFQMGLGLGYISKPFHLEQNLMNNAIGSCLNVALQLKLLSRIVINNKLTVLPGISIRHFSNGAYKLPNKGINIAGIDLAIEFGQGNRKNLPERNDHKSEKEKINFYVGTSIGLKEVLPIFGPKYPVYSLFTLAMKRVSPKSSAGLEAGGIYNTSLPEVLRDRGEESPKEITALRAHVAASYKLHFGNLGLLLQAGVYVFDKYEVDGPIFLRYHLQYNVTEQWILTTGLKSHYANADNAEFGIVYKWN